MIYFFREHITCNDVTILFFEIVEFGPHLLVLKVLRSLIAQKAKLLIS